MKKSLLLFAAAALVLAACHGPEKKTVPKKKVVKEGARKKPASTAMIKPTVEYLPADGNYPAYILTESEVSHQDEVDVKYANYDWVGLFKSDSGYFVKQTKVFIRKVPDEMMDDDGWEVKPSVKDSSILLISGLDYLQPAPVTPARLSSTEIMPGKPQQFTYGNINYTLYATGKIAPVEDDPENVVDYQLYLKATVNGINYNQKLVSVPSFDGTMVNIRFAGDIDGDGRPDFILDTTNHYNSERPTLYLSKPAKNGNLLKVVGLHTYVGC